MPRPPLYHTDEEKKAANRLKSKRHYEKNKSKINEVRRKKYRKAVCKAEASSETQEKEMDTAPISEDVHINSCELDGESTDTLDVHALVNSEEDMNVIADDGIPVVNTSERLSTDIDVASDLENNTQDMYTSDGLEDDSPGDFCESDGLEVNTPDVHTSDDMDIRESDDMDVHESDDMDIHESDDMMEPEEIQVINPLDLFSAHLDRVESNFYRYIDFDAVRFMNQVVLQYRRGGRISRIQTAANALSFFRRQLVIVQDQILQSIGPHSDIWVRAEFLRKTIGTSINWIEDVLCTALLGSQEVTDTFKRRGFEYQQK